MAIMNDPEYSKVIRNFRVTAGITLAVLGIGTVFYHIVEKFSWLDSIYFCVITLATVGYGDFVPHTPEGKVFTIFYVLIGISIIATFANLLLKRAYIHREVKEAQKKHGRGERT